MRSSFNGGSAIASLSHQRANAELRDDELYMGINVLEVENQNADPGGGAFNVRNES